MKGVFATEDVIIFHDDVCAQVRMLAFPFSGNKQFRSCGRQDLAVFHINETKEGHIAYKKQRWAKHPYPNDSPSINEKGNCIRKLSKGGENMGEILLGEV